MLKPCHGVYKLTFHDIGVNMERFMESTCWMHGMALFHVECMLNAWHGMISCNMHGIRRRGQFGATSWFENPLSLAISATSHSRPLKINCISLNDSPNPSSKSRAINTNNLMSILNNFYTSWWSFEVTSPNWLSAKIAVFLNFGNFSPTDFMICSFLYY